MTRKRKSFHNPHTTFSSLAGRRRYYSPFKKENAPPKKYICRLSSLLSYIMPLRLASVSYLDSGKLGHLMTDDYPVATGLCIF